MTSHRLQYPATQRNRDAILDVLRGVLPPAGLVLEIASDSGEHIVHFANALPGAAGQNGARRVKAGTKRARIARTAIRGADLRVGKSFGDGGGIDPNSWFPIDQRRPARPVPAREPGLEARTKGVRISDGAFNPSPPLSGCRPSSRAPGGCRDGGFPAAGGQVGRDVMVLRGHVRPGLPRAWSVTVPTYYGL